MGRRCTKVKKHPLSHFFYTFILYIHSVSSEEDRSVVQENPHNLTVVLLLSQVACQEASYAGTVAGTFLRQEVHGERKVLFVFLSIVGSQDDAHSLSSRSLK
jgi:hypothetical protein